MYIVIFDSTTGAIHREGYLDPNERLYPNEDRLLLDAWASTSGRAVDLATRALVESGIAPVRTPSDAERWAEVRERRNALLSRTDPYMVSDYPITADDRKKVKAYRTKLRDITDTDSLARDIEFPVFPLTVK